MTDRPAQNAFCSDLSRAAGEPLIGSATPTTKYLLVEVQPPWGTKALVESDLLDEVKQHLKSFSKRDPKAKTLLIYRPRDAADRKLRVYLASSEPGHPALYAFSLTDPSELMEMDFDAILAGDKQGRQSEIQGPLILVCANGRRDACCARLGTPVFNSLAAQTADQPDPTVWQCTHLGGHRFAANLVVLPHGLLYGRVDPVSAAQILAAARAQQVYLPNLRGRTAYPLVAQAADYWLRQQTGALLLDALHLEDVHSSGEKTWKVVFKAPQSGVIYRLHVQEEDRGKVVYESCQLDKSTRSVQYQVVLLDNP